MLGSMGILLTLTPPGQHAQRIERSVGSMAVRRRTVLASLLYVLALRYEVYSKVWVAQQSNAVSM